MPKAYYVRSRAEPDDFVSFGIYVNAPGPRVEVARFHSLDRYTTPAAHEAHRLARERCAAMNAAARSPDHGGPVE